ncbi:MAG TPA: NAD-dependent epimerase/dehydratase family protein [Gaiellaceae bacterium]|nr:NAD-dependent epimerase/dehydratase family protein [Gaiellaceae bacterium]
MKGAIVTGGAGFIGAHLCRRLLAEGYRVEAIDDLSTGDAGRLPRGVELHIANVAGEVIWSGAPVDLVFHLACPASPIHYQRDPLGTLDVCSRGTMNALVLARRCDARFILASTSEVYGDPLEHPQRETYLGNVDPVGPRSMYDEGKRFAEALTTAAMRTYGLEARIARIFNTYGPGMDPFDGRIVPTFVRQALANEPITVHGDGRQTRSFCYVDDLVEGLMRLALLDVDGAPVNLGNPIEDAVLGIAMEVKRAAVTSSSEIRFVERPAGDPERRRPDITRAVRMLNGWQPRIQLREGLARTIAASRVEVEA